MIPTDNACCIVNILNAFECYFWTLLDRCFFKWPPLFCMAHRHYCSSIFLIVKKQLYFSLAPLLWNITVIFLQWHQIVIFCSLIVFAGMDDSFITPECSQKKAFVKWTAGEVFVWVHAWWFVVELWMSVKSQVRPVYFADDRWTCVYVSTCISYMRINVITCVR